MWVKIGPYRKAEYDQEGRADDRSARPFSDPFSGKRALRLEAPIFGFLVIGPLDSGEQSESNFVLSVKALEALHPMFYLPETERGEIARIEIASTIFDVTCLFAKTVDGHIHDRVVDEYDILFH